MNKDEYQKFILNSGMVIDLNVLHYRRYFNFAGNLLKMITTKMSPQIETDVEELLLDELIDQQQIVLYNDDVNTFDWVIESLVKVCKHQVEQAEQCAHLVHYTGKCAVKEGSYDRLVPLCTALLDRGLSATIE